MTKDKMQERLIDFAVAVSEIVEALPYKSYARYLGGQVERSGTSPALNYAEACAAESDKDLLHKDKLILKELRETYVALRIIGKKGYLKTERLLPVMKENDELISIFVKACESIEIKLKKKQNPANRNRNQKKDPI
jgi:four helix bundle protein